MILQKKGIVMAEDLESLIAEMQGYNQILQNVMLQKQAFMIQSKEIEQALTEVEKSNDDLFKMVGPILVKMDKEKLKTDLEETKEQIDLKIRTMEKQEKKIADQLKSNQEKLQGMINLAQKEQ